MIKKLMKNLLVTAACATLVAGGTTVTALAEGIMHACPHDYFTIEDIFKMDYEDCSDNTHTVYCCDEIYCWDCGAYFTRTYQYVEGHNYNGSNICIDCGHRK